jgi:hypothetical protein
MLMPIAAMYALAVTPINRERRSIWRASGGVWASS